MVAMSVAPLASRCRIEASRALRCRISPATKRGASRIAAAMAGQVDASPCGAPSLLQRVHVVAHRAVGRRHDRGRPAHDVVAGKHHARILQRERHVVRGVAGRGHGFERPAVAAHHVAVGQRVIGAEVGVVARLHARRLAGIERARRAVRALGIDGRAGRGLDGGRRGRMVAMGVGDEDVRHGLAAHRIEHRLDVVLVLRTRIDDRDLAAPEDVAERALEGERPGIVGDDAAHARHDLLGAAGLEVEDLSKVMSSLMRSAFLRRSLRCTLSCGRPRRNLQGSPKRPGGDDATRGDRGADVEPVALGRGAARRPGRPVRSAGWSAFRPAAPPT